MHKEYIGLDEALQKTLAHITPLDVIDQPLSDCLGYAAAENVCASVDAPSVDTSLKDGFAVRATDIVQATADNCVHLKCVGTASAGGSENEQVLPQTAVRVLTGARMPDGADAVVAEEYARRSGDSVIITEPIDRGHNILPQGSDIARGQAVLFSGERLTPGKIGLLAAAGCSSVSVFRKPRVAIIATGDEVVLPGRPLNAGQVYASNLLTLNAWCRKYGLDTGLEVAKDNAKAIKACLKRGLETHDAVLTSGGAWTGDRDLMAMVLEELGWQKVYHRVRLGPGKAVGFGRLEHKPIFILPGGPPSNLVAFLQLALPGLVKLSGIRNFRLTQISATLKETVKGQRSWTQAVFGCLTEENDTRHFQPLKGISRLKSIAAGDGLLLIPEGITQITEGETVMPQLLAW
jgi:molybdopterin molybdotransferase